MLNDIFNISEIQDFTYKTQWWKSNEFEEWQKLAGIDPRNKPKNNPSEESEGLIE